MTGASLFDARGRLANRENAGRAKPKSQFRILAEVPGRYGLEPPVAGQRIRRAVQLRTGRTIDVNLIAQAK